MYSEFSNFPHFFINMLFIFEQFHVKICIEFMHSIVCYVSEVSLNPSVSIPFCLLAIYLLSKPDSYALLGFPDVGFCCIHLHVRFFFFFFNMFPVYFVFYQLVVRSRICIRLRFHFFIKTLHGFPSDVYLILHHLCKATDPLPLSTFLKLGIKASLIIYLILDLHCALFWSWDFLLGPKRICPKLRVTWPFPEMLTLMPVQADDDITSLFKSDILRSRSAVSPLILRAWNFRKIEICNIES